MRVLAVDDDPQILSLLRRGLALDGYTVDTAADGEAALKRARTAPPDLVVLDVMMPGMDGLEVARRLREAGDVPIIFLTAKGTVDDRVAGLNAGADDYVVKPFALDELLARVRAHLRRRQPENTEALRLGDLSLNTATWEVRRGERLVSLSAKEHALLELFLRHPKQVLTRDLIYERVWGYDFGGESNVIEVYVRRLRRALEAGGEPPLIHTVRGAGYVLDSR